MIGRWFVLLLGITMLSAVFAGPVNAQETSAAAPAESTSPPPAETSAAPPPASSPPPSAAVNQAPPPPPCGEGSWWDQGQQQCVSSNTYNQPPPPPRCGEGSWWDEGKQQCVSGNTYNQPPACSPEHPCQPSQNGPYGGGPDGGSDHYGNGSDPRSGYQPYRDECSEKFSFIMDEFVAYRDEQDQKAREFHESFARARMDFSKARHTADEWRAFTESWTSKGKALYEATKADLEARFKDRLGGGEECWQRFGLQGLQSSLAEPMRGGPHGPGGGPMQGGMGPPGEMGMGHMPSMGPPPDDQRFKMSEEAEQIRKQCEQKVWAIIGPPPHEKEAYAEWVETHPEAAEGPPRMTPEIDRQIRDIMRECEKRIRATFQDEYHYEKDEEDVKDFKEKFGSLDMYYDEDSGKILVQGKHLALEGNPESQMIESLTCQGALFIDQLFVNGLLADFSPEDTGEGTALRITDSDGKRVIDLHDNPRCVVNVAATGEIPSITIDLADHLEVERNKAGDLHFTDGDVGGAVLLHGANVELEDGNLVTITGKATFLVQNKGATNSKLGGSAYDRAIEDKNIGAEIKIAADEDDLAVDEVPLGDLETKVEGEKDRITVTIDSEEGTGKTVVLEIDGDVFSSDALDVVVEGVDEEGEATDLNAVEASDLNDVLDPLDDGKNTVEYWIVEDKNGFHVLVSFPHFSEKRVTIQSADAETKSFVPGFEAAFLVAALVLCLVVVGLRRRDE